MTYKEIYDKFLIEYDKAGVSSSYPSLTKNEIAALLDKAARALIAQKVTGNNPRKAQLDVDIKGMSDLQSLFETVTVSSRDTTYFYDNKKDYGIAKNEILIPLKDTKVPMYLRGGHIEFSKTAGSAKADFIQRATVLSSIIVDKFRETDHNKPWLKSPVMFLQDNNLHILLDSKYMNNLREPDSSSNKIYLKIIMLDIITEPQPFSSVLNAGLDSLADMQYEMSVTMCEELISLAVIFACKTVENPRLTTEIQTKSLEA